MFLVSWRIYFASGPQFGLPPLFSVPPPSFLFLPHQFTPPFLFREGQVSNAHQQNMAHQVPSKTKHLLCNEVGQGYPV